MTRLEAFVLFALVLGVMWLALTAVSIALDVWPSARAAAVRLWQRRRYRALLEETTRHVVRQERAARSDAAQARRQSTAAAR